MGQAEIYKFMQKNPNKWFKIGFLKEKFGKSAPFCCKKMCEARELVRQRQVGVKGINPPYEYMYDPKTCL